MKNSMGLTTQESDTPKVNRHSRAFVLALLIAIPICLLIHDIYQARRFRGAAKKITLGMTVEQVNKIVGQDKTPAGFSVAFLQYKREDFPITDWRWWRTFIDANATYEPDQITVMVDGFDGKVVMVTYVSASKQPYFLEQSQH